MTTNLDKAVWALCPYIAHLESSHRGEHKHPNQLPCDKCPQSEEMDGEIVQRGCRALCEEALKPVFEALSISKDAEGK